jgi:hypothetical protein
MGVWVGLGLGAGALLGLTLALRAARRGHAEMAETVEELRERTQRVLNELSEGVSEILEQTRLQVEQAVETGREFGAAQKETLEETIVHGPEDA